MEDDPDCGWMTGLPDGWVCAKTAVVRYCNKLAGRADSEDLEPLITEGGCLIFPNARRNKDRDAQVVAAFQSALLSGSLSASIFDGHDLKPLPKAAFLRPHVIDAGLRNGSIELDPLWPDEWRPWNGHGWAFPNDKFESWLSSRAALGFADMPPAPSLPNGETVETLQVRGPSRRKRVSLSEAVSWVAFGLALDADRLNDAIRWDRLSGGDLLEAQRKIAEAIETLLDAGADEKIEFHGRHAAEKGADGGTTAKIEPHQLDDYRQFLIGFDKLHGGTGLKRRHSDHNHYRNHASDRPDLFTHVTVNRADLMRFFAADRQLPPDFNLLMPTGEPGRPTKGKQIYSAEHQRRCKSGIALVVLACEVDHLVAWFKTQHPEAAPPTAKTVSNRIRAAHREYKASQSPKNIDIA